MKIKIEITSVQPSAAARALIERMATLRINCLLDRSGDPVELSLFAFGGVVPTEIEALADGLTALPPRQKYVVVVPLILNAVLLTLVLIAVADPEWL